jgi:hypothetical protein
MGVGAKGGKARGVVCWYSGYCSGVWRKDEVWKGRGKGERSGCFVLDLLLLVHFCFVHW